MRPPLGDQPKFFDEPPGTGPAGTCLQPALPSRIGLSYTMFTMVNLSATPNVSTKGTANATFTVKNTGRAAGHHRPGVRGRA